MQDIQHKCQLILVYFAIMSLIVVDIIMVICVLNHKSFVIYYHRKFKCKAVESITKPMRKLKNMNKN